MTAVAGAAAAAQPDRPSRRAASPRSPAAGPRSRAWARAWSRCRASLGRASLDRARWGSEDWPAWRLLPDHERCGVGALDGRLDALAVAANEPARRIINRAGTLEEGEGHAEADRTRTAKVDRDVGRAHDAD